MKNSIEEKVKDIYQQIEKTEMKNMSEHMKIRESIQKVPHLNCRNFGKYTTEKMKWGKLSTKKF